jgi:hypothetical protein
VVVLAETVRPAAGVVDVAEVDWVVLGGGGVDVADGATGGGVATCDHAHGCQSNVAVVSRTSTRTCTDLAFMNDTPMRLAPAKIMSTLSTLYPSRI